MERLDLATHSKQIKETYERVVKGDPETTWVVYSTDKNSTLSPTAEGADDLNEFVDQFVDGKVQFGIAKVSVPGTEVTKLLLLGWCPDNAPLKSRTSFASNFAEVGKILHYHVQITARDQDDLDVDDFLYRIGAASGARYSIQSVNAKKPSPASKPVVAAPKPKPKPFVSKPIVPKTTGKPIATTPIYKPFHNDGSKQDDDGWGGEKELEERDFSKKPLESVPSAYKPIKVDMNSLRQNKSDTISSTSSYNSIPVSKPAESKPTANDEEAEPQSLADRMKTYKSFESNGRLTELPKPKISNSVSSRFKPAETTSFGSAPTFGAKPSVSSSAYGVKKNDDKLVGGLSRNFGAEGGKTPAQIWAEKHGKYSSNSPEPETTKSSYEPEAEVEVSGLREKFSQASIQEESKPISKPISSFQAPPKRNLPPPAVVRAPIPAPAPVSAPEPELEPESEPESEPEPQPESEPEQEEEEEKEVAAVPPPPPRAPVQAEPIPLPPRETQTANGSTKGSTATAEYDYEKDEDNEIAFLEGEIILNIEFLDEEWWKGENKAGEVGLFPASYVKLSSGDHHGNAEPEAVPAPVSEESSKHTAIAEYDYEKDEDNEISFVEGEKITEIEFIDDDWWQGKNKSGEIGLFPSNYVKLSN